MMDNIFYSLSVIVILFTVPAITIYIGTRFMSVEKGMDETKKPLLTALMLPYIAAVAYGCYWWTSTCITSGWLAPKALTMQFTDGALRVIACIICGAIEAIIFGGIAALILGAILLAKQNADIKAIRAENIPEEEKKEKIAQCELWTNVIGTMLGMFILLGGADLTYMFAITWGPFFFPFN